MGKFKFDKAGVRKIEALLKHQVTAVQKKVANSAYHYLSHFTYKATLGGESGKPGGWTWYYVANWNVSIGGVDHSVITDPYRDEVSREVAFFADEINEKKSITITEYLNFSQSVFVTNSVDYGQILNDGGSYGVRDFAPNRFLEGCIGHIAGKMKNIIKEVAQETPSI